MQRRDSGLTLIETMVVLGIAAVVLALGVPSFVDMIERQRVTNALYLVSADMAMARGTAIMRRSPVVVCPRNESNRCSPVGDWTGGWLVFADPDNNRQPDRDADLLRVQNAPIGGRSRLRLPSSRRFLRYQPDGRSAGTNLTVHVCVGNVLKGDVAVNNLGRVRTSRPKRETACPR